MADELNAEQLGMLRELLVAERRRFVERVANETPDSGDQQDMAAGEVQSRDALTLSSRDEIRLREVEAALARMENGTYGVCEETDEPIPFARLRAEPTTRYTVEALEILEDERARERVQARDDNDPY